MSETGENPAPETTTSSATTSGETTAGALMIEPSVANSLPAMVRNELATLAAQRQEEFVDEYDRHSKGLAVAYLLWFFFGLHYAYMRKWGVQVIFWLTLGGVGIWWIVDAFRMPGLIKDYNKDKAVEVLRNLKAITVSA